MSPSTSHIRSLLAAYSDSVLPMYAADEAELAREYALCERFLEVSRLNPRCFESDHRFGDFEPLALRGHFTGSALVLSPCLTKIVLTLHKKLGKWLQLGGHADGNPCIDAVALREAYEESGLKSLEIVSYPSESGSAVMPFDLDIHEIPGANAHGWHHHFDIRFLMKAQDHVLTGSDESEDLQWFTLEEAYRVSREESLHRQLRKLRDFAR